MKKKQFLFSTSFNRLASYDSHTQTISFMGNMQQSVQRIDHELAHYVYDTLMQSADYTGPSKAELAIRLQQKRTEPDFQEIPAALDLAVKLKEIERTVDLHKRSYGMALEIYTELTKRPWDEPCLATLSASERDFIETLNEEMLADLKAYGHAVNPLIVQGVKIQESVNKAPIVFTGLLRNKKHIEHTEKNLQSIEHYFSLEESFYEKAKEIERITKALGYGPHEQEMQDSDLGKIYDSLVTLAKKKKISLHQPNFREIEKERIYYMFARESEMLVELEKTKTYDSFFADTEFFARMVDSLCAVYFGPVNQLDYPLTEEDVTLLSSMQYEGQDLFGKCNEKYELGRTMKKAAVSSEQIKSLKYATHFQWQGKEYVWPATDIHFMGKIPFVDNSSLE